MAKHLYLGYNSDAERDKDDFYATDPYAVEIAIPALESLGMSKKRVLWECACGKGHISNVLLDHGYQVFSSDKIDRGYGQVIDFLEYDKKFCGDIITNPPFKLADKFLEKALSVIDDGGKVFLFLKIQFLEGKARRKIFDETPPKYVAVYSERQLCARQAKFNEFNSKCMCFCWFVFEKGFKGRPQIIWI